ncbi:glycosyltransferase family 4 protein [Patescibacteria group bacterium]|nr:glycosyltransferase family 4 protein [Patescibacteria group bacterium]
MKKLKASKVLHLTTHLGGGVGSAVLGYLSKAKKDPNFTHKVVCLNYAEERSRKVAAGLGVELLDMMNKERETLLRMIAEADLVLIHLWNHPLLYDFLVREKLPACRVVVWSHVSGLKAPNVFTKKILRYPDMFVFTTPISLDVSAVKKFSVDRLVIWSTGGVEYLASSKSKKHSGFNIGYLGTVDYAKLCPNFLDICSKIDIPDVRFIICGDDNGGKIKEEAQRMGIDHKFNFVGWVSDIHQYLSTFDLFGYPLLRDHYGTCDHVLQESMAAGVVPVVLNNKMEMSMVQDGKTGIVAKTETDYIKAVQTLYNNAKLRKMLSNNARQYALCNFSIDKMVDDWNRVFSELLKIPKTPKRWDIQMRGEILPKDVFLESIGDHGKIFSNYCNANTETGRLKALKEIASLGRLSNWSAETKGTVHNYYTFLPADKYLTLWSKTMRCNVGSRHIS